jgi:hypothetical protein
MLIVIAAFTSSFKSPNFEYLRGVLLLNEVKNINDNTKEFKETWKKIGWIIIFNGWTNGC